MPTKTTTPAPAPITEATTLDLAEQIGETQRQLDDLEIELEGLPAVLQQAGRDGNAEKIIETRRRATELPLYISATRVRLLRLQIEHHTHRINRVEKEIPDLYAEVEPAQKRLDEAERALRMAHAAWANSLASVGESKRIIGQLKVQLDRAIAEGSARPAHIARPA